MVITVNDLDKNVKAQVRDDIMKYLLKKDRVLPLPSEVDKIISVVSLNIGTLQAIIRDSYSAFFESDDITVDIKIEDFVNIYLNRI